jgi:quinol monooxygenase YgiN
MLVGNRDQWGISGNGVDVFYVGRKTTPEAKQFVINWCIYYVCNCINNDLLSKKNKQNNMNKYLLHGKLTAKPALAGELANILIQASELVATANGCNLYVISKDSNDLNSIWITEIWDNKEDHDNSLKVAGVRELIMKAMPILEVLPQKGQELEILGGTGL